MENKSDLLQELVNRPAEKLQIETKRWINPSEVEGIAKIAKTTIALRNSNGGYLVIGFDNNTLEPDLNVPADVRSLFHVDNIQAIVSRFSSEPFEVVVEYRMRDNQEFPIIIVPPGARSPVASKSELRNPQDQTKFLVKSDVVYVRSLSSNNTPSTTEAKWKDWPQIMENCFENREADVGRFLRRHLGSLNAETLKGLLNGLSEKNEKPESIGNQLLDFVNDGQNRFEAIVKERKVTLPQHGAFQCGLIVLGPKPEHRADNQFLNLLSSSNPGYSGWPVWLISNSFQNETYRPFHNQGAWEALIADPSDDGVDIDFMRLDPTGMFYLYRALIDDITRVRNPPKPMTALDVGLPISLVAEAIAVGISFAKSMQYDSESSKLYFLFQWNGLKGRKLSAWAQPEMPFFISGGNAYQDSVKAFVDVPINISVSSLSEYVYTVVKPLYEIFSGYSIPKKTVEVFTSRLVERKNR